MKKVKEGRLRIRRIHLLRMFYDEKKNKLQRKWRQKTLLCSSIGGEDIERAPSQGNDRERKEKIEQGGGGGRREEGIEGENTLATSSGHVVGTTGRNPCRQILSFTRSTCSFWNSWKGSFPCAIISHILCDKLVSSYK